MVYTLIGGDGSPYSCKMRAYFRFRRLPFLWVSAMDHGEGAGFLDYAKHFPRLRARVIPILVRPDGTYANDSTFLIRELEERYRDRPSQPQHKGASLLSDALEDVSCFRG